jgi:hypothetical protein
MTTKTTEETCEGEATCDTHEAETTTRPEKPAVAPPPIGTKGLVIEMLLDLAGYVPTADLPRMRLIDPCCGRGGYLVRAIDRLLEAAARSATPISELEGAIVGIDVVVDHVEYASARVRAQLLARGVDGGVADRLVRSWLRQGDFLLTERDGAFDFIVGNPPQGRLERLDPDLAAAYRERHETLRDRADLSAAFVERSIAGLSPDGTLAFVLPDRWLTSRSGRALREVVSGKVIVRAVVDLRRVEPFERTTGTYPIVLVAERGAGPAPVSVVTVSSLSADPCLLAGAAIAEATACCRDGVVIDRHDDWFAAGEPWTLWTPKQRGFLRRIEESFQPVEETSCVGCGITTGADDVYIVHEDADVERDRLMPIVMRDDLQRAEGRLASFVLDTFDREGRVVELTGYPRLRAYLERHEARIRARYVARRSPSAWYRTIDRPNRAVVAANKLVVPDLARGIECFLVPAGAAVHHNLTYITSSTWDLRVLGGLLMSSVARAFVEAYAPTVRGGYLRLAPQVLRRIVVPPPESIPPALAAELADGFARRDRQSLDFAAARAYGIDVNERTSPAVGPSRRSPP